jgi:hypothetical protein
MSVSVSCTPHYAVATDYPLAIHEACSVPQFLGSDQHRAIIAGLLLGNCRHYVEQPTAQEKEYAEDSSVCAALAQQLTQNPAAYDQCMTGRGWSHGPARQL